jgi:hypothetical protein
LQRKSMPVSGAVVGHSVLSKERSSKYAAKRISYVSSVVVCCTGECLKMVRLTAGTWKPIPVRVLAGQGNGHSQHQ